MSSTSAQPRRTLLAVVAHPDDETIGPGGTLARAAAEGHRVVVATCTGGEAGLVGGVRPAQSVALGDVRARELADALEVLGVDRSVSLGYQDSGLLGWPENDDPASLYQADPDEAAERLVRVLRAERPDVVIAHDVQGGYGHPDHVRAHQLAVAAFHAAGDATRFPAAGEPWAPAKLYAVVFPRTLVGRFQAAFHAHGIRVNPSAVAGSDAGMDNPAFGLPDEQVSAAIDVRTFATTKRRALAAHRTQMGPDQFFMRLPADVLADLWSVEYFQRLDRPEPAAGEPPLADLFAGLP